MLLLITNNNNNRLKSIKKNTQDAINDGSAFSFQRKEAASEEA